MRELLPRQKKMLLEWANKNLRKEYMFDRADEIDRETFDKINDLNPCEIFNQNVNHYLETLKPIYKDGLSELGIIGWKK